MASVAEADDGINLCGRSLDVVILERMREEARKTYKAVAEALDEWLFRHRPAGLCVEHKRLVWYKTVLGRVHVMRRQYRDKAGAYRYLLDEFLGVRKYLKTTLKLVELVADLVTQMTFRRSAEVLDKTTPLHLSAQSLLNLLERVAAPYIEEGEAKVREFLETGALPEAEGRKAAQVLVEADGVYLSLQREKQRKAEVKTVIGYEGWWKEGKSRYRTLNKFSYADVASSDECWASISLRLQQRYGEGGMGRLIVGGDGAPWIREGADYLGGIFQLDHYHLNREITLALGRDRASVDLVREACRHGDLVTALDRLSEVRAKMRGEAAKRVGRLYRYLVDNRAGLRDYRLDLGEQGKTLRSTGAIEGNVDKLVVKRMKNQGMNWTIRGIRRMLCIRLLRLEGKLPDRLRADSGGHGPPVVPRSSVERLMPRAAKRGSIDYWQVGLPALNGPHPNRPWVTYLRSLTRTSA